SAVRGAFAARFGLPSAVRGVPAVLWFNHWPCAKAAAAASEINMERVRVRISGLLCDVTRIPRRARSIRFSGGFVEVIMQPRIDYLKAAPGVLKAMYELEKHVHQS